MMSKQEKFKALISPQFDWSSYGITDRGKVRKQNEDALMSNDDNGHWAVADGMGGHSAGNVASEMIVKHLARLEQSGDFADFIDQIEDSLIQVNKNLVDMVNGSDSIVGSTVVGMALRERQAIYYWAGDSRLYLFRDDSLVQLSVDHTAVQELLDKNVITIEQARNHPEKNIITRAIGSDIEIFVEFSNIEVRCGDVFLLCSDGLEKELSDEEVEQIIRTHDRDIIVSTKALVNEVLVRGSRDNVTVILVQITDRML